MASIYDIKPAFQNLLRPLTRALARNGVSANQVTLAAAVLSGGVGGPARGDKRGCNEERTPASHGRIVLVAWHETTPPARRSTNCPDDNARGKTLATRVAFARRA